jgi:hypothetical protein
MLQAFPSALSLSTAKGNTVSGIFNLQKSSTQQSTYSISANQSWTALNPPYGSTQTITTEIDPITVTVNTSAMNIGTYSGVVYIVESGPQRIADAAHSGVALRTRERHDSPAATAFADGQHNVSSTAAFGHGNRYRHGHLDRKQ